MAFNAVKLPQTKNYGKIKYYKSHIDAAKQKAIWRSFENDYKKIVYNS